MKYKKLYETAQLLKAGQVVQLEGDSFRAKKYIGGPHDVPCVHCSLDSICWGDILDVCCALEDYGKFKWYLELAHPL